MSQSLNQIAIVVKDYDEAIKFYTEKLGFILYEDKVMSETKRWVVVGPIDSACKLLLAKAVGEEQISRILFSLRIKFEGFRFVNRMST